MRPWVCLHSHEDKVVVGLVDEMFNISTKVIFSSFRGTLLRYGNPFSVTLNNAMYLFIYALQRDTQ